MTAGDSAIFAMAKNQYHACMDLDRLERIGLEPLRELLKDFGGWPAVDGSKWDENSFDWYVSLRF